MTKKIILACILVINFVLPQVGLAIGQLTEPIVIEDVMKGQEFIETLSLFNSKDEKDTYTIEGKGDVADWLTFYSPDDISFESPITQIDVLSKSYQDVSMKINVPSDVPNGEYIGQAVVATIPADDSSATGTSAAVRQKIGREISIKVTDEEIIALTARVNPAKYDIEKNQELIVNITYENQGNILLTPTVSLKITNTKDNTVPFDAIFSYPVDETAIAPKTVKTIPVKWQSTGQEKGRYQADVKVILKDEVIFEDDFRFNLGLGQGSILSFVETIGRGNIVLGWFIIGIFLLIIAGILYFINRRRKSY